MSFFSLKNKLFTIPLKYGLMGGGIVVLLFIIFYLLDLDPLVNIKMIDMLILAIFIFFALKEFRDSHNNRELHFWQGMTGGVVNYVTIAIISSIFVLVMTVIIDPEMTTNYIEGRIQLLQENKQTLIDTMDEDTFLEAVAGVENTTAIDLALDDFLKKSMIGLFLTIIIAVILRK
jgi:hypothetical protein